MTTEQEAPEYYVWTNVIESSRIGYKTSRKIILTTFVIWFVSLTISAIFNWDALGGWIFIGGAFILVTLMIMFDNGHLFYQCNECKSADIASISNEQYPVRWVDPNE